MTFLEESKKTIKPALVGKSFILLDVKVWDNETYSKIRGVCLKHSSRWLDPGFL